MSWDTPSLSAAARTRLMKSGVVSSSSPRCLRWAFMQALRKVMVVTPGISSGYWKARKMPLAARSLASMARMSSPLSMIEPPVTS